MNSEFKEGATIAPTGRTAVAGGPVVRSVDRGSDSGERAGPVVPIVLGTELSHCDLSMFLAGRGA